MEQRILQQFTGAVYAGPNSRNNTDNTPASINLPPPGTAIAAANATATGTKPRKINFTLAEVECLLKCVLLYRDVVLFSVQGGRGDVSNKNSPWLQTWERIAGIVSKVDGIKRTEADCRKKWTYLKWEARNTSKPTRDPVSKCVFDILTARNGDIVDIDLTNGAGTSAASNNVTGNTSSAMGLHNIVLSGGVLQQQPLLPVLVKIERRSPIGETYPALLCRSVLADSAPASSSIKTSTATSSGRGQMASASPQSMSNSQVHKHRNSMSAASAGLQQQPPMPPESPPNLVPIPNMQSLSPPPQSQDVCLRWNSYYSNMQHSFPMLLDTEQFVDVTLACEGQLIKCHKVVLSACSTFFSDLLRQNPCQHPVIVLRGSRFWEIRSLVDFMYRGEVNVAQDRLPALLAAAEELQVKGLAGSSSKTSESSPETPEAAPDSPEPPPPPPPQVHHPRILYERERERTSSTAMDPNRRLLKRKAVPQKNESSNAIRPIRPAPTTHQTPQHQQQTASAPSSSKMMKIRPRSFANTGHLTENSASALSSPLHHANKKKHHNQSLPSQNSVTNSDNRPSPKKNRHSSNSDDNHHVKNAEGNEDLLLPIRVKDEVDLDDDDENENEDDAMMINNVRTFVDSADYNSSGNNYGMNMEDAVDPLDIMKDQNNDDDDEDDRRNLIEETYEDSVTS